MSNLDEIFASLHTSAQSLAETDRLLRQYAASVVDPSQPISVTVGTSLQPVIDRAPEGSTLVLEPGVYVGPIRCTKPVTITSRSGYVIPGRVTTKTRPPVMIIADDTATVTIPGKGVALSEIGLATSNGDSSVVDLTDCEGVILDQCEILGDPVHGAHRGVIANGHNISIVRCRIDDCFGFGRDCMAVGCWDGADGLAIADSYLGGGAMSFMAGGGDSTSAARMPRNITIDHCTLSKNPAWYTSHVQIKNAFELKCAINVKLTNSILEYAGTSAGQGGYLIVLTPRNQDGGAPWSTVQHVTIENCIGRYAGGVAQFLGTDDGNVSGGLLNTTIHNCAFSNIDPKGITGGRGRLFEFSNRPQSLTLADITVQGKNLGARGYFTGPVDALALQNLKLPVATYDWKIDAGGMGLPAVKALCPDAVIDQNPFQVGANPASLPVFP